jgi:TM2 domain-containing membrane protein YozV
MFCPNCGKEIPDGSKFCPYCGASLEGKPGETQVQGVLSEEERKKKAYEEELIRAKARQAARVGARSPGLAAVLSFLYPGLGQIYNGQIGKAILFIILGTIFVGLMFVGIGFILYPIMWIIGMVDAYNTAKNANDALLRP